MKNLQELASIVRSRFKGIRALIDQVLSADWSYEKAFYYITIGLVLISLMLKIINKFNMAQSSGTLMGTAFMLCLTILASAFFLAHGTRLLIRAIKKDMK